MANEQNKPIGQGCDKADLLPSRPWDQVRKDIEDFADQSVESIADMSPEDVRLHLRKANINLTAHKATMHQRLASLREGMKLPQIVEPLANSERRATVRNRWVLPRDTTITERVDRAYYLLENDCSTRFALDPVSTMIQALAIPSQSMVTMNRDTGRRDRFTTETLALEGAAKKQDIEKEKWIETEAEAILRTTGAMYPPIHQHFGKLTDYFSLLYKEVRLPKATIEGAAVMDGRIGAILINISIQQVARRQFTWAHELGHYILHGDLGQHTFHDSYGDLHHFGDVFESEANLFASSLLLPKSHLRRIHRPDNVPRLAAVNSIIDLFKVSALAAMYRVTRSTEHPCALLVFKGGSLSWCLTSPSFQGEVISEKFPAPPKSTTATYINKAGKSQDKFFVPNTPAEWWITKGDYSTADESAFNVNQNYVYTLLTFHR